MGGRAHTLSRSLSRSRSLTLSLSHTHTHMNTGVEKCIWKANNTRTKHHVDSQDNRRDKTLSLVVARLLLLCLHICVCACVSECMDASLFEHLMLVLLFCMRSSTMSVCSSVGLLGGRSFYWSDNPLLSALPVRILGFDLTSRELLAEWSSDGQASMERCRMY